MGDWIDGIVEEFDQKELVLIAEQINLSPTSRWGSRYLTEAIIAKLNKDGIPDAQEAMSRAADLLEDFLYVINYIDEDGDIVPHEERPEEARGIMASKKRPDLATFMLQKELYELPPCFTYADDADPSCSRCMLYVYCAEERLASLQPCFALLYDPKDDRCIGCMEAPFCKSAKVSGEIDSSVPAELQDVSV